MYKKTTDIDYSVLYRYKYQSRQKIDHKSSPTLF